MITNMIYLYSILAIWLDVVSCETPYHYISQVPASTPRTLNPKPLFAPHDIRRLAMLGKGGVALHQLNSDKEYRYGTKIDVSTDHNLISSTVDPSTQVYRSDQNLWYPVYSDVQYPGLLSVGSAPYDLTYGTLPQGYEPKIPLRGDPLGYSFSYQAGDHSRHETSDGRGNFFSSFSFVPPAGSLGYQSKSLLSPSDLEFFSTARTPAVNIPAKPNTYTSAAPSYRSFSPSSSTARPVFSVTPRVQRIDRPTARPLVSSDVDLQSDFVNGYNFGSRIRPSNRVPQTSISSTNHALSTNIQHDHLNLESRSKVAPSGSRRVTILSTDATVSPQSTTERSYVTLSRSLPLAFSSQRLSTSTVQPSSVSPRFYSERAPSRRRKTTRKTPVQTQRSASRRSTTEIYISRATSPQSTTALPVSSTTKQSVVQKIPRKLKTPILSNYSRPIVPRPEFIDDLTSLAYSSDKIPEMNNTIIQIKSRKDKSLKLFETKDNKTVQEKTESTRFTDHSSKDGYVSGNKTYLAGLGLRSNIHY